MRRRACAGLGLTGAAALLVLLVVAPAAQAASLDLGRWAYYRQIDTREHPDDLVQVRLDDAVWAGSRSDLADLRIVDETGQEIPSQVDFQVAAVRQLNRWLGTMGKLSKGKADGSGSTSFELDLGGPRPANHFHISAAGRDFWKQVSLQGSSDGKTWTPVISAAFIYDFYSLGGGRKTDFTFPGGTYRYLRVSILDLGTAPLAVEAAWATDDQATTAPLDPVPSLLIKPPRDPQVQGTVVIADLGVAAPPIQEITLETPDREFRRFVKVEASSDGATWQPVGEGAIYRYDLPTRRAEGLSLSLRTVTDRYLRLTMPSTEGALNITRIDGWAYPRYIQFRARAGHRYALYYGAFAATAPSYPADSLGIGVPFTLPDSALGPQLTNAGFHGVLPGTPGNLQPGAGSGVTGGAGGTGGTGAGDAGTGAGRPASGGETSAGGDLSPGALAAWSLLGAGGLGAGALAYYLYARNFVRR